MNGFLGMIKRIINRFSRDKLKKEWRNRNRHNKTSISGSFHLDHVTVGKETYGVLNVVDFSDDERSACLVIGNFCSIADNVTFILNGEHNLYTLSSFPFRVQSLRHQSFEAGSKGDIVVGDDVWIGHGCTILSGVVVGQGAVLASGALINESVPPYAIVGGIPAKIIRYRFDEKTINRLLKFDFDKLTKPLIQENIDLLYSKICDDFFESDLYRNCLR